MINNPALPAGGSAGRSGSAPRVGGRLDRTSRERPRASRIPALKLDQPSATAAMVDGLTFNGILTCVNVVLRAVATPLGDFQSGTN
jgi:hypothetical protein